MFSEVIWEETYFFERKFIVYYMTRSLVDMYYKTISLVDMYYMTRSLVDMYYKTISLVDMYYMTIPCSTKKFDVFF